MSMPTRLAKLAMVVALPAATWPAFASAQSTRAASEPAFSELLDELRRTRILLESIDARLQRIERSDPATGSTTKPSAGHLDIDTASLRALDLAPDPTPAQVQAYVDGVVRVSARQAAASPDDPQIGMLARVGPERFATLLQAAVGRQGPAAYHLVEAMKRLAAEEHKRSVIEALPRCHAMIAVVTARGWEPAARGVLVGELRKVPTELPPAWIEAVAALKDPATYGPLRSYLVEGANRPLTYDAIRLLPGIKLEDAVDEAWQRARHAGDSDAIGFAPIAADYGHLDALETLADGLRNEQPALRRQAREDLLQRIEARGSDDELRSWLAAHRGELRFDADTRLYKPIPNYQGAATQPGG